jgi:anti-sigma factor RsiW
MTGSGKCGEIRRTLGVYLLGAISPADRSALGRHLGDCAECKEELAQLAGLPGLLGTVPAADVIRLDVRPAAAVLPWATTVRGSNPRTGTSAAVRYVPQSWGVGLEVQVSGIPAGTTCELRVISSRGPEVAAGGWMIAEGHAGAWYPASSPFPVSDVRAFAVTTGGKVLVSVPLQ